MVAILIFLVIDLWTDWAKWTPLGGLFMFLIITLAFSKNPRKVSTCVHPHFTTENKYDTIQTEISMCNQRTNAVTDTIYKTLNCDSNVYINCNMWKQNRQQKYVNFFRNLFCYWYLKQNQYTLYVYNNVLVRMYTFSVFYYSVNKYVTYTNIYNLG